MQIRLQRTHGQWYPTHPTSTVGFSSKIGRLTATCGVKTNDRWRLRDVPLLTHSQRSPLVHRVARGEWETSLLISRRVSRAQAMNTGTFPPIGPGTQRLATILSSDRSTFSDIPIWDCMVRYTTEMACSQYLEFEEATLNLISLFESSALGAMICREGGVPLLCFHAYYFFYRFYCGEPITLTSYQMQGLWLTHQVLDLPRTIHQMTLPLSRLLHRRWASILMWDLPRVTTIIEGGLE